MKTEEELLSSILKTTQMGQSGIRTVMPYAESTALQQQLRSQLQEYDEVETRAKHLASERGWDCSGLAPIVRTMSSTMSKMKLQYGDTDSKIADMMILGNTRGLIKGMQNLRKVDVEDSALDRLSHDLLQYEHTNINSMKPFL